MASFFISALKAGGKIHGEPKTRDSLSGYYSAAVIDFDGNSIEAVFRSVPTEVCGPTMALLENGSAVSKVSRKAITVKSDTKSQIVSKVPTIERAAPSIISHQSQSAPPSYVVQTTPKSEDGSKTAKTIVGTLIGAAAGAAIAYAMVKGDSQPSSSSETHNPPPGYAVEEPQTQIPSASQDEHAQLNYQAIEAPPSRSVSQPARSTLSRGVSSKNPHASTIYEGTGYAVDEPCHRSEESIIYNGISELPLRAIEHPPTNAQQRYPCSPSTFISSYSGENHGARSKHSSPSTSTIKASQTTSYSRHSHDNQRHSQHTASHHSHQSTHKSTSDSTAPSTRTARNIPLPPSTTGSSTSYLSSSNNNNSYLSARAIPLPESVYNLDLGLNEPVTPEDSISQVGSQARSTHSHRSSHSKLGSRSSRSKHTSRASTSKHSRRGGGGSGGSYSKFEDPVLPSDSVSQISRASQRAIKTGVAASGTAERSAAESKASRVSGGSRRGSQVV